MTTTDDLSFEAVCGEVVVRSDGESAVSRATQTGDVQELVQITASLPRLMQRIEAFASLKRQQVNAYNLQEFCSHSAESGGDETCARTNAVYVRRGPQRSNITVHRVANASGPTAPPLPPLEALKCDLMPRSNQWERSSAQVARRCGVLGLSERLASMEKYTQLYKDGSTPRNLVHRVQNLELKLLELESHSREYDFTSTST